MARHAVQGPDLGPCPPTHRRMRDDLQGMRDKVTDLEIKVDRVSAVRARRARQGAGWGLTAMSGVRLGSRCQMLAVTVSQRRVVIRRSVQATHSAPPCPQDINELKSSVEKAKNDTVSMCATPALSRQLQAPSTHSLIAF